MVDSVIDHYVKHQLMVDRFSVSEANKIAAEIVLIDEAVAAIFNRLGDNATQTQINSALVESFDIIRENYETEVIDQLLVDLNEFNITDVNFHRRSLNVFAGGVTATLTTQQIFVLSTNSPFQGRLLSDWARRTGEDKVARVENAVRNGFISGAGVEEIRRDVQKQIDISNTNARAVVRSSVQHYSNGARSQVFKENDDLLKGVEWNATLDNRTTPHICAPRDGLKYTISGKPIGHNLDWLGGPGNAHFNCRSTGIPDIKGIEETGRRPSIGAGENYAAGDNTTNRGTVRKATKRNREKGIYAVQQKNASTKYDSWLKSQPADFQDDILGKTKGALFRRGDLSTRDMSTPFGKPIPLSVLEQTNASAFEKANIE